jgi:hypothetical protein
MIENSFVYAVNIYSEKKKKKEAKRSIKEQKLREILIKKDLQLGINAMKKHFNKTELSLIESLGYTNYLIMNEKYFKKNKKD